MDCKEIREQLSSFIDNQLNDREQNFVKEHLKKCSSCDYELKLLKKTSDICKLWTNIEPAPNIELKIIKRIEQKKQRWNITNVLYQFFQKPFTMSQVAVAAIIMIVVTVSVIKKTSKPAIHEANLLPEINDNIGENNNIKLLSVLEETYPVNSQMVQTQLKIAEIYGTYSREQYYKAISIYKRIIKEQHGTWQASYVQYKMAECYEKQSNYSYALKEYQQVINRYPESKEAKRANNKIARIITALNEIRINQEIIKKYPNTEQSMEAKYMIADIYYCDLGNYNMALNEYNEYLRSYAKDKYADKARFFINLIMEEYNYNYSKAKKALYSISITL